MNWKYTSRTTAKHYHNFLTQWLKQTCKIDNTCCINKNNLSELLTCHTVVGWCFLCIHTGQMSCCKHYCKHRQYHNHILAWNQKRVLSNDYSTITRNIAAITGNNTLQWGIQWGTATINEKKTVPFISYDSWLSQIPVIFHFPSAFNCGNKALDKQKSLHTCSIHRPELILVSVAWSY